MDDNILLLFFYIINLFVLGAGGGNDSNKDNALLKRPACSSDSRLLVKLVMTQMNWGGLNNLLMSGKFSL